MNQNTEDREKEMEQMRRPPAKWGGIIWLLFAFLAFYFLTRGYNDKNYVDLSYSDFKQHVKSGNVAELTVKGQDIVGTFKTGQHIETEGQDSLAYSDFKTVRPPFDQDELMKSLQEHGVTIRAEKAEEGSWWQVFLISFLPWLLIIGYFVYASKRMQGRMKGMFGGGLFSIGKSRAKRYRESKNQVTFKDVAGLENVKRDLQEIIEYLKMPEKFTALGADIPKGILLVGPPGTGKTLLARATAGEANVSFYNISGSEFIEMFVGVGASRVRDMFQNAKQEAPSIIFIDEIDSIGRARGTGVGGGHDEREQTLNQILSEMDGFAPHESVIVMAATNRPDVLDSALTRPGRFDRQLSLELPQKEAREKILEIHLRKVKLSDKVDVGSLAARTVGFSGADLKNLVNEATLLAGRKHKEEVESEDFDEARDKILLGQVREDLINDEEKKVVACHEAGHALLAKLMPGADPLKKVTIIPRGRSLGATEQMPDEDRHNVSRSYLLNRIAIMLGGRTAEKLMFGDFTNGAANDLKQVTQLVRQMVCQWGMSEKLGAVAFQRGEEHMFLGREIAQPKDFSEHTAKVIDDEVHRIIQQMEEKATRLLQDNRSQLEALAEALLKKETLTNEEVDQILSLDVNDRSAEASIMNMN